MRLKIFYYPQDPDWTNPVFVVAESREEADKLYEQKYDEYQDKGITGAGWLVHLDDHKDDSAYPVQEFPIEKGVYTT